MSVSFGVAFLAGLATFFSPCILPIIPGYLSVLATNRTKQLRRVTLFILGMSMTFVTLGTLVSYLGTVVVGIRDSLTRLIGIILVMYGIHLIRPLPLQFLNWEFKLPVDTSELSDSAALLLGVAFGLAWTPCSGIILGLILTQALYFQAVTAALLLLTFSLGLSLPLLVATYLYLKFGRVLRAPQWWSAHYNLIVGVAVLLLGLLLACGFINSIQIYLLNFFPALDQGLLTLPR